MASGAKQHGRQRSVRPAGEATGAHDSPSAAEARLEWKDAALLAAIVLFAFALRLVHVLQLRSSPLFDHPQMDELYHDQWAQAIVAGKTFIQGPYFRAPLYPAFLAAVYTVFGHDYLAPRIVQAVLGGLSCGLLFLIGRKAFGRAIGAVAGFAAGSYWMLIYFDGELLIPSLIVFLDLLLIWLLLHAARAPGKLVYALAGIVLGLSATARPNVLLFGPAVVIWLLVVHRRELKRALAYAACITAGCLLAILPITVRNYVVGDDLVLIASQGGVNFYIGNNPQSDGHTAIVPGTPGDWWGGYYATIERAERALGRKLKPSEVSRYYYGQAWDFIRTQPGRFLALLGRKLQLFWSHWEIANNKGIYFWTEHFTPIVRFLPLPFAVIGPLGILGLVLCWRRRGELFPLWGFVLVYMASVVLFFCTARYRTPVLPPLILLAVDVVFRGMTAVREARWKPVVGGLVVLAPAAVFVNLTPAAETFRNDAQSYVMLGRAYEQEGRADLAVTNYRQALEIEPEYLLARYNLGTVLGKSGRLPEAIAELRRAVTIPPRPERGETQATVASVHSNLGNVLFESGAYTEAIEQYRAALELRATGEAVDARRNLARALVAQARSLAEPGDDARALEHLAEAIRLDPDLTEARVLVARILLARGDTRAGIDALREAYQREPQSDSLANDLAWYLATTSGLSEADRSEALRLARQAVEEAAEPAPGRLDTLAAALAATGQYAEAVRTIEKAISLAEQRGAGEMATGFRERLELYKAGKPYVDDVTFEVP
jgi:tetratricopeptide (TPR) repeat protein